MNQQSQTKGLFCIWETFVIGRKTKKKQVPSCVVEKAISTAVDAALAKNNSVNLYF